MKLHHILASMICFFIFGCSTLQIVPEQVPGGHVNVSKKSQTLEAQGVAVTVRVDESGSNAYNLDGTVTALHLSIKNNSKSEIAFSETSFVLVDENGLQYSVISPEAVRSMLKKDSYYLMPYPYVGFYYLEDFQKSNFYNRFNSSLPYYYELYPQDLFTNALQFSTIIPDKMIEGLLYFKIDPSAHRTITLMIFPTGDSKSSKPIFSFPFNIKK